MALVLTLSAALYLIAEIAFVVLAILTARDGDYWAFLGAIMFAVALPLALRAQIKGSGRAALGALRARPPTERESAELEPLIERVAAMASLPPPVLRVIGSRAPNALAIAKAVTRSKGGPRRWREGHTIVLTTELRRALDTAELESVVAHEIRKLTDAAPPEADLRGGTAVRPLWIVSPSRRRSWLGSEHPPVERRIARLERLAAELRR